MYVDELITLISIRRDKQTNVDELIKFINLDVESLTSRDCHIYETKKSMQFAIEMTKGKMFDIWNKLGDDKALELFCGALNSNLSGGYVAEIIIDRLGRSGDKRAIPFLKRVKYGMASLALCHLGDDSQVKLALNGIGYSDTSAKAVAKFGDSIFTTIVEIVVKDNEKVNYHGNSITAIGALGYLGDERAIKLLIQITLNDSNSQAVEVSISALLNMGTKATEELGTSVLGHLGHKESYIDDHFMKQLMRDKNSNKLQQFFISSLKDDDPNIRYQSANVLKYGSLNAVDSLIASLSDDHYKVAVYARIALWEITGKSFFFRGGNTAKWQKWWLKNKDGFPQYMWK